MTARPPATVVPRAMPTVLAALSLLAAAWGCGRPEPPRRQVASAPRAAPEKLLLGALTVLDRLDDFDEARGIELVFDRVNQWARAAGPAGGAWRPDQLFDRLPQRLRSAAEPLDADVFTLPGDVTFLRDQRWLADIARVARGDALDDVAVATKLFQWTVRSLALVGDPPMVPTAAAAGSRWCLPGEILLSGRASPAQRAWIFLELLRHAGLDGVMLATGGDADAPARPWIPALVADGEAYLFEPAYGMPVPGPDGGVATVRQAAADPAVLGGLSLPDRPYPLGPADMRGLAVLVPGDAWNLSRRMARLDVEVRGLRDMRLALDASALGARAAAALPDAGAGREPAIGLWEFPWETLARRRDDAAAVGAAVRAELAPLAAPALPAPGARAAPGPARPLFAARVREFRGDYDGETGAKAAYMAARPSREAVAALVRGLPEEEARAARAVFDQVKEDAAYWLGVVMLAEGEDEAAVDYLRRMTLETRPDSRWTDAARTNLAQALIALGRDAEAAAVLREDLSPQRFGSRILAARLEERPAEAAP